MSGTNEGERPPTWVILSRRQEATTPPQGRQPGATSSRRALRSCSCRGSLGLKLDDTKAPTDSCSTNSKIARTSNMDELRALPINPTTIMDFSEHTMQKKILQELVLPK